MLRQIAQNDDLQRRILDTLNVGNVPLLSLQNNGILVEGLGGLCINENILKKWERTICRSGYSYAFHTLRPTIFLKARGDDKKINFFTRLIILRSIAICDDNEGIRTAIRTYLTQFEIPEL